MKETFSIIEDMNRLIETSFDDAVTKARVLLDADFNAKLEFLMPETIEAINDAAVIGDREFFKQDINEYLEKKNKIEYAENLDQVNNKVINDVIEVSVFYIKKFAETQEFYDFNKTQRLVFGEQAFIPNTEANDKYNKMANSTTQLFQKVNDPYCNFIKQKEWLDYWSYLPYNKAAVES